MKDKATFKITMEVTVHNTDTEELSTERAFRDEVSLGKEDISEDHFKERIEDLIKSFWNQLGPAHIKDITFKIGNTKLL